MNVPYLKVSQPIGTFYLTSIPAVDLVKFVEVKSRGDYPDGVQRQESALRIKEITRYCSNSDATFPTSIIVSVNADAEVSIDNKYIIFNEDTIIGDVIDGQHRLKGLMGSKDINKFELPVVFMFDLEAYQKAYVFSTINSKQTKVNMSLIYDLFALSIDRSPYKTCHEIARAFNQESNSPFYNRLKMLGVKEKDQKLATLSQGTFVKYLLPLISKKPDEDTTLIKEEKTLKEDSKCPLRDYFIKENDTVIYKILMNYFKAVQNVFKDEWEKPDEYILSKSIGFGALIGLFSELYTKGVNEGVLDLGFFTEQFKKIRSKLSKPITSDNYGSNEQARASLTKDLIDAYKL